MAIKTLEDITFLSQEPHNASFEHIEEKITSYLNWVNACQLALRHVFADSELDLLLGRGYWHICNANLQPFPLERLINEEIVFQVGHVGTSDVGRLGEAANRLRALARLGQREGSMYVLDTNALLHYTRIDQLDWRGRMGAQKVRLIIPLIVIDEIDSKKYARRGEYQDRARDILTLIDRTITNAGGGYMPLREGVTAEVLPDEEGHFRAPSADQEILERCEFLHQMTGHPVTLVTGDSGVRINARSRGIAVFKLSHDDLLPRYTASSATGEDIPEL